MKLCIDYADVYCIIVDVSPYVTVAYVSFVLFLFGVCLWFFSYLCCLSMLPSVCSVKMGRLGSLCCLAFFVSSILDSYSFNSIAREFFIVLIRETF